MTKQAALADTIPMRQSLYRGDIDGLRAIAVLSVIAFHLSPDDLGGGYLGVDVFFVISGYLITGIIAGEMREGHFSFWDFYARRVRRILPALLVVIVATLLAGYWLMLPDDYGRLADSARWAAFGISNIHFWMQSGYFEPASTGLPLLHTWSLGVEEQFYLVWPLLLFAGLPLLARLRLPGATLAVLVGGVSLVLAILNGTTDPDWAFYSPLARAWQLALGAVLAFVPAIRWRWLGELAAAFGLAVLGTTVVFGNDYGLLGNIAACVAAACLLWPKSSPSVVGTVLALPPIRGVGLISYSLYLWHWPVLVLASHYYQLGAPLTLIQQVLYLLEVLSLATLSWLFIERPFRSFRMPPAWSVVGAGLVLSAIFAGIASTALDGLPSRFPANDIAYLAAGPMDNNRRQPPDSNCFITSDETAARYTAELCLTIAKDKPNVLLIGDSHAYQFIGPLREGYPEINFSEASGSGCFSLLGEKAGSPGCIGNTTRLYEHYLSDYHFDAVIIANRWRTISRLSLIEGTLDAIAKSGATPYILGPNTEYTIELPTLLSYEAIRRQKFDQNLMSNEPARTEAALKKLLRDRPGVYYSLLDLICDAGPCVTTTSSSVPLLRDQNHLSGPGARWVVSRLRQSGFLGDLLKAQKIDPTETASIGSSTDQANPADLTLRGAVQDP